MIKICAFLLSWLALLLMGACANAPNPPVIAIDAGEILGEINPYVYGANFGPLSAINIDLFPQAQNSGIRFLRFPGGRWGDLNDLQPFQIDMFMRTARLLEAEPSIHVRLENGSPQAAAEIARYANIEKEYNVRYWHIGNEPNLFDEYTTGDLNREWRLIAEAMLAVDPNIILIGPDISQWNGTPEINPRDPQGRDWLREFLLANGDLVDIVSIHRYPFPKSMSNPVTTIPELRANVSEWDTILPNLRQVIHETTGRDLPVAITEVNSHWSANIGGEATTDSHYNAIWWADVLGRLIQHDPIIINYFDLQSSDSRGGWGLLARYNVRPTYYVYQLYQRFGNRRISARSESSDVSVYAALREDGALTIIFVNLSDEEQTYALQIQNFAPEEVGELRTLDLDHQAEIIDSHFALPDSITLTPQSATLMIITQR